jgi:hypothetical protein
MKRSAFRTYVLVTTTLLAAAICALAQDCGSGSSGNCGSGSSSNNCGSSGSNSNCGSSNNNCGSSNDNCGSGSNNNCGSSNNNCGGGSNNNCSGSNDNCGGGYTNDNDNCGGDNDGGSCGSGNNNNCGGGNNGCGGNGGENDPSGWGCGGGGGNCGGGGNGGGNGNGNQQGYTVPTGTITVNTPDPTTMQWAGQTKPHEQMLSNQTYSAQGQVTYPPGANVDPNCTVGITRLFQTRGPNNTLSAPVYFSVLQQDSSIPLLNWLFSELASLLNFGPYEPDLAVYKATGAIANAVYGVETVELVYSGLNSSGQSVQTVLDSQEIDIYQPAASQLNDYTTQAAVKPATSNYTYAGSAPRVATTVSDVYPGSTTWLTINGNTIPNTTATSPIGDQSNRSAFYVDAGSYVSSAGTYVVQVMEKLPNGTTQTVGSASFNFTPQVLATSAVGVAK